MVKTAAAATASPADAAVWTMLFSRMLCFLKRREKMVMEMTAAGMEADTVMPAKSPR